MADSAGDLAMANGDTPQDLRRWLLGSLIPNWAERAVVPGQPGYLEYLTPSGEPDWHQTRTTLVTARLVYVFSFAHFLQPSDSTLAAARHGLDFLLHRCRGGDGLFRHAVDPSGQPIEVRTDLYDLAFVLFALAWFSRATGDARVLEIASEIMEFIEARLAHPEGGFTEDTIGTLPRRQNPHMHLLEAFHALAEASADARWFQAAGRIVLLLRERLYDHETGSLGEFFTDDWAPAEGVKGGLREPGHHFEWTWLLLHHARLSGDTSVQAIADRLYAFGLSYGLRNMPDGLPVVVDEVDRSGRLLSGTRLLWPQTEAIKAFAARVEFLADQDAERRLDTHLQSVFRHYVKAESGLWANQLSASGQPVETALPTRVLYHLVMAIAEAARIRK
jgi:mannose/cellobiose epimerase-like protein (N-acyl-D-glucosamine 2-epimerase family)